MINTETRFKLTPKTCLGISLSVCLGSLSAFVMALSVMAIPVQPGSGLHLDASAAIDKNVISGTGQRQNRAATRSRTERAVSGRVSGKV